MISTEALRGALAREWGLHDVRITAHHGGMNSGTWWVDRAEGGARLVAKSTPAEAAADFQAGLAVAALVERAGIPAGASRPARSGALTIDVAGLDGRLRPLALLTYVPGVGLTNDEADLRRVGETLGRVHVALRDAHVPSERPLHPIDPEKPHARVRDWIVPAVTRVLDEYHALGPESLTPGLLHTDPAPEAFLASDAASAGATGDGDVVGIIDWSAAIRGPLMYDVASAVMYAGGRSRAGGLLEAYLATGALDRDEVDRSLSTMLRYRGAIQALYFAWRTANNDLTGIADASENETGLDDARAMLA